ncbi:TetR/AcrR family transcriptional regulator [Actinocrispum wychmicini]|uniref:TetR family transcriptional regulator n=1 Tax=Actinocrispum wychmicini TaxID=1213861 RepID=A0A4R2IMX3_9PSEU|nr:TetR/AcrR family transcriptional regulator [Actinocrispum wychmicini]TCO46561.1 TetR family transcriptional regulator [Actinocrispum wychmicini]
MSPEKRREMIVSAVLPLLVEYGAAITTSQIARAAGIGEATVFRAFTDKDELLDACVAEAVRMDHALDAIAAIPLDIPLDERLVEAASALAAHMARMGALFGSLHASGYHRERRGRPKDARRESLHAVRDALAELFEPEAGRLRLPAAQLAMVLTSLMMNRGRSPENAPSTAELIDLFLHGALT